MRLCSVQPKVQAGQSHLFDEALATLGGVYGCCSKPPELASTLTAEQEKQATDGRPGEAAPAPGETLPSSQPSVDEYLSLMSLRALQAAIMKPSTCVAGTVPQCTISDQHLLLFIKAAEKEIYEAAFGPSKPGCDSGYDSLFTDMHAQKGKDRQPMEWHRGFRAIPWDSLGLPAFPLDFRLFRTGGHPH